MIRPRTSAPIRLCLLLALAPLMGCASTEPDWYRLAVVPGPVRTAATSRIDLREVVVARALDQAGIARATSDVGLTISNNQRWAAPLGDMVAEVLAQDLEQRLPGGSVRRDTAPITDAADVAMGVVLDRFEADATGNAVLSAQLTLRLRGMKTLRTSRVEVVIAPDGRSTAALVTALSLALGRVADRAASTLSIPPDGLDLPSEN